MPSMIIQALVLLALVHPLAEAQTYVGKLCGDGTYSAGSPYETNLLSLLLGTLRPNAYSSPSLFSSGALGTTPDTVWSLVLCRGDVSATACYDCVTSAGQNAATACNRSRDVALYYDRCYVRLTNHDFLSPTGNSGEVHVSDGTDIASNDDVDQAVTALLSATVQHAVADSSRLFATGKWVGAFGNIYSAAQCAADLSPPQCRNCLNTVLGKWWTTFPQSGESATMAGPRCTLRSQLTPFYNGSAMVLLPTMAANGGSHTVAVVIGVVVALVVAASLAAGWFWRRRCRSRRQHKTQGPVFSAKPAGQQIRVIPSTFNARHFPYEELVQATDNFNKNRLRGKGAFGAVYEGTLAGMDTTVAIKEIQDTSSDQTKKAFDTEIKIMSQLHHRNILSLKGWCNEGEHLLLIYEMMENGNLEEHLYPKNGTMDSAVYSETDDDTRPSSNLSWVARHNILTGIASGLAYLHTECTVAIVHRDIKPANVMLDKNLNAKLADFGLVTQLRHTQTSRPTNNVIGTLSYIDPAYTETGKVSGQCDVYSLGVVLLEIVCGRRPSILQDGGKNKLVEMVRECNRRNMILDAADKQLRGQLFDQEMEAVLRLGLQCVLPDRHNRPHVGRVRDRLTELLTNRKASTYQRRPSEGEFGTCRNTLRTHSHADEEAGVSCLLAG